MSVTRAPVFGSTLSFTVYASFASGGTYHEQHFVAKLTNNQDEVEFDQNNKYVKEWLPDSYGASFAHAVRVDAEQNVWVVDEGSNTVVKVDPTKFRLVPPSQYHTSDSEPRPVDGPDAGQYRLSRRAQ